MFQEKIRKYIITDYLILCRMFNNAQIWKKQKKGKLGRVYPCFVQSTLQLPAKMGQMYKISFVLVFGPNFLP